MAFISKFRISHPRFSCSQDRALEWLTRSHVLSEANLKSLTPAQQYSFENQMTKFFHRFGCSPTMLGRRFYDCPDFDHFNWDRMEHFNARRNPRGPTLKERMSLIDDYFSTAFDNLFPKEQAAPSKIIHVTCTGYQSPNAPQKMIAQRQWNDNCIELLQLYHMGCYASIPAVRTAGRISSLDKPVDIVHTESCTMHIDPTQHSPEQIVVQSLFGDGNIRYTVSTDPPEESAFELIDTREWIAPGTQNNMSWGLDSFAFSMGLSRKVPSAIESSVLSFLETWFQSLNRKFSDEKHHLTFAIHPGGPKIINSVQESLKLSRNQCRTSYDIFQEYGNISSATLPHIWGRLLDSDQLRPGDEVISIAFGPGLTIAANLLRLHK